VVLTLRRIFITLFWLPVEGPAHFYVAFLWAMACRLEREGPHTDVVRRNAAQRGLRLWESSAVRDPLAARLKLLRRRDVRRSTLVWLTLRDYYRVGAELERLAK
jgi:hypothetical protein